MHTSWSFLWLLFALPIFLPDIILLWISILTCVFWVVIKDQATHVFLSLLFCRVVLFFFFLTKAEMGNLHKFKETIQNFFCRPYLLIFYLFLTDKWFRQGIMTMASRDEFQDFEKCGTLSLFCDFTRVWSGERNHNN